VKKGQRIAEDRPGALHREGARGAASLQNVEAKVVGDRADMKLKKLLFERNRVLLQRNLIAQNDLDTAETTYGRRRPRLRSTRRPSRRRKRASRRPR